MNQDAQKALELARRIADGETVDLDQLDDGNSAVARGLGKLGLLARAMRTTGSVGQSWGHLQQLELAGEGGFGEVYRAYDPTLDRTVALKLKREDGHAMLAGSRDFVAEARRLARVRHAHVLAVHGASFHNGRAGLWTDWIDGETLSQRLQRSGPVPPSQLLRLLHELADAIDAVHAAGLVHGDIKASNVMLDSKGRVLLMDFGAGFESSDEGSPISAGTPRYLAPEVIAGHPATRAVDLYAFGVLAYLIATGVFPDAKNTATKKLPGGLRRLLVKLLNPYPELRPSADQLRRELQQLLDAPQLRTRRWLWASIVTGLIAVIVATAIGLRGEQIQRQRAEAEREAATKAYTQAQRVNAFLSTRIQQGAPTRQQAGVSLTFKQWVLDSIPLLDRELRDEPEARALLRHGFALSLSELGDPTAAAPLGEQALAEMRSLFGQSLNTARALITQAIILHRIARYDEAQLLLEECLTMLDALPATKDVRDARNSARTSLLRLANTRGDHQAALRIGQENIAERSALFGADDFHLAVDYNNLANTLQRLGRLAEAEVAVNRARALLEKDPSKPTARVAMLDEMLCVLRLERGQAPSAVALCRGAIEQSERTLGMHHAQTLRQRAALAGALLAAGEVQQADSEIRIVLPALQAQQLPMADALLMRARVSLQQRQWQDVLRSAQESAALMAEQNIAAGLAVDRAQLLILLAEHALRPSAESLAAMHKRTQPVLDRGHDAAYTRAYAAHMLYLALSISKASKEANAVREQALIWMEQDMDRVSAERQWAHWLPEY